MRALVAGLLLFVTLPAMAIYKCETAHGVAYSDTACPGGKPLAIDGSSPTTSTEAQARAAADRKQLHQLEQARHKREAVEDKEQRRLAQKVAAKNRKCAALAQRKKWDEEDAAQATGKSADKARKRARRAAEKFTLECGA
jgi:hypothetical protein